MEYQATEHRATASPGRARPTPATASHRPARRPMVQARTEPLPTAGAPGLSPTTRPRAGHSPMDHSPTERERPAPPRTALPQPAQARAGRPPAGRARTDPLEAAQQHRAGLLRAPLRRTAPARPGRTRLLVDPSERPSTQPANSRRTLPPSTAAARSSATAAAPADQLKAGGIVAPAPPITTSPTWSNPAPASPPAPSKIPATRPAPTSPAPTAPAHLPSQPQPRLRTAPAVGMVRAMPATRALPPRHQRIRPTPQRRPVPSGHAGTGSTTCGR
jgi:hypothetical protein